MKICNLDSWICKRESVCNLSATTIKEIQLKKLNLLLERKNLPVLHSLEELTALPFTTADMLSKHPASFLQTSQSEVSRVISGTTSGTTGPSKRVFYTEQDTENTTAFFAEGIAEMMDAGEKVLINFPFSGPFGLGDLIAHSVERIGGISIPPCGEPYFQKQCGYLKEQQPQCYIGAAVPLLSLLRCYQVFYPNAIFPIRKALVSGDACPDGVMHTLEKELGTKLFPHYGSRECGLGGAVTCQAHNGMHLRDNDIIAEIVDQDLKPVPKGEWGELVLTTIGLHAMPLLRYRTGDYTRILAEPCPCGSALTRLDKISRLESEFSMQEALDSRLFLIKGLIDYKARMHGEAMYMDAILATSAAKAQLWEELPGMNINTMLLQSDSAPFYTGKRTLHFIGVR